MRRYGLRYDQWIGSNRFCRAVKAMWAARRRTFLFVEAVLFRFRAASLGAICPSALATGRSSIQRFNRWAEERRFRGGFQALGQRSRQRVHDD